MCILMGVSIKDIEDAGAYLLRACYPVGLPLDTVVLVSADGMGRDGDFYCTPWDRPEDVGGFIPNKRVQLVPTLDDYARQ